MPYQSNTENSQVHQNIQHELIQNALKTYNKESQTNSSKRLVCLSKDCIAASHRIFEYMDDQVDPCEDFNKFACGGFIEKTIIPDDKGRQNPMVMI